MVFTGGTLVTVGKAPIRDSVVIVRDGKIDCAGTRADCRAPQGAKIVDIAGMWITPGLIDAHVHYSQTGWGDGRPDAFDVRTAYPYQKVEALLENGPGRFHRAWLCSGVTSVYDVGGYPWTVTMAKGAGADGPNVAAAGPLLSTIDFWLNLPAERQFVFMKDEATVRDAVRYLAAKKTDAVKVWYIVRSGSTAEEFAPLVMAAGDEAKKNSLPLIVHATALPQAKIAARAGAQLLVHSVSDPIDEEFIALLKEKGTIYTPTLTVAGGYVRMGDAIVARKAPEIDDPNGCIDRETRAKVASTGSLDPSIVDPARASARRAAVEKAQAIEAANLRRLYEAGIPIAMGTDAGNPLTLHGPSVYAEMEAMQRAGLPARAVLDAATIGSARAMRRERELGSLEKGKVADLLIVAADPTADIANLRKVRYVVRGGVLRSLEELKAK